MPAAKTRTPRSPGAKAAAGKAARKPAARDAIVLLKADHAEVKKMHRQYEKLVDDGADASSRGALASEICHALTAHATAEEELFYPAARQALADDTMLDHADVEHACAKSLISQIEAMHPDDSHFDAKVVVLCEYVAHHVKEEETQLFPACRKAGTMDLKALGASIVARKAEVMAALLSGSPAAPQPGHPPEYPIRDPKASAGSPNAAAARR